MTPATRPRDDARATRLLVVDAAAGNVRSGVVGDLHELLRPGDLLVCNDAATLPASLFGHTAAGVRIEVRLAGELRDGVFLAVLFGGGDWHQRTEDRPPPPRVAAGEHLQFAAIAASIIAIDAAAPRLVTLCFDRTGAELWRGLYGSGRPVQYSHLARPLALWDVQTPFAGRPWAVEAPSAGLPVTWELLSSLRAHGVRLARITHGAGLSSTGDGALDARLPFPERYEVPAATVREIEAARARSSRVVAVGTTTVRALESAGAGGALTAHTGITDLRLHAGSRLQVVDAILTGMHELDTSHFTLLEAFAPRTLLLQAMAQAEAEGFLAHEFGDLALVVGARDAAARAHGRAIALTGG